MAGRNPATTCPLAALLVAAFLLLPGPGATSRAEDATDVLKGTVVGLKDGVLTLKGVRFQDETIPPRDIKVRTDKDTGFYDGPTQVSKEAIVPDLIVLVRWTLDGADRKAVLVRIIGGKKS